MNKTELVEKMAERLDTSKKDSREFVDAFLETITEALGEGERIQLTGFGTFEVRDRKAREGRNPRKPEEVIHIPASKAPVFKAGKTLKDYVNER